MHNFKKVLLVTISFVLCVVILFGIIITPAFFEGSEFNDNGIRKSLAGKIDCLFLGASHARAAFDTKIIDEELGIESYNLSSDAAYMHGRYALLENELSRNNPNTVVLEISMDVLSRTAAEENSYGEPSVICKLDTTKEKISYALSNISFFSEAPDVATGIFLRYGLKAWIPLLKGKTSNTASVNKGYVPKKTVDVTLSENALLKNYQTENLYTPANPENVRELSEIVKLCHGKGIRVIIAVTPISEAKILEDIKGLDEFNQELSKIGKDLNCLVIDFNLLKQRFDLFSDSISFGDETHMSDTGAKAFSKAFADIIKLLDSGADVSSHFYNTYAEMIENSSYIKLYIDSLTQGNNTIQRILLNI